jgi:hypothetical protein
VEIKTPHGPFRFRMSQEMAVEVADQIGDHATLVRPRQQNYPS